MFPPSILVRLEYLNIIRLNYGILCTFCFHSFFVHISLFRESTQPYLSNERNLCLLRRKAPCFHTSFLFLSRRRPFPLLYFVFPKLRGTILTYISGTNDASLAFVISISGFTFSSFMLLIVTWRRNHTTQDLISRYYWLHDTHKITPATPKVRQSGCLSTINIWELDHNGAEDYQYRLASMPQVRWTLLEDDPAK